MAASEAKKKTKRTRRWIGIQWRLWGYLSVFVLFVLIVLWIFQIQMLNRFYENSKGQELQKTANAMEQALGDDTVLQDTVYHYALEYATCIQVFRVDGSRARIVASADVSGDCIIHHVTGDYLSTLYHYALENEGTYTGKVQFRSGGMVWIDSNGRIHHDGNFDSGASNEVFDEQQRIEMDTPVGLPNDNISALHIQVLKTATGEEYIVMLDAVLTPMSATVSTLKTQFLWIAAVLLLGALLLAYLMSRRISRPLIHMNEAARALARGNYEVHFSGNGYRETRELAQTLNYAAEELSKNDRLQKELIANVSHDLRTPLTMIRGYGEVMRDLPGENTPENVQVIMDEAERLSELVDDLLDLSRLQAGTRQPELEVFDLTETVRSVMSRYEKLTRYEGYDITFCAEEAAVVCADRTMILQVVYNLINNAINYAGDDRRVEVRQQMRGSQVRICVRDYGEGIEPEQLPLIWDRYYKVDRVHRRAMVGTGLGLSIAKDVLELHQANYGVQSLPGQGTTFWFELLVVAHEESEKDERNDVINDSKEKNSNDRRENEQ